MESQMYVEDPDIQDFPAVPLALVEALEKLYPNECPSVRTPDRDIWVKVGQVSVCKFLRERALTNRGE